MNLIKIVLFFVIVCFFSKSVKASDVNTLPEEVLIQALMWKESKNNPSALGDKHLKNHAYGILQIRKPVIDDVNRAYGTNYTIEQCYDIVASVDIFRKYILLWKKPGMTYEHIARIWNGGPNGAKMTATLAYWQDVRSIMLRMRNVQPTQTAPMIAVKKKRKPPVVVKVDLTEVTRPTQVAAN